jgi:hypothetical protein
VAAFPKSRWFVAAGIAVAVAYAGMATVLSLFAPGDRTGFTEIPGTFVRFVRVVCDCWRPPVRGVVMSEHADGTPFAIPGARFCESGPGGECAYVRDEADASGRFDLNLAGETVVVTAEGCDPRVVRFEDEQPAPHRIRLDCPRRRAGPPETPPIEASVIFD